MKINELLNIEFPIFQGGMANIATGEFAAAVSNAGNPGKYMESRKNAGIKVFPVVSSVALAKRLSGLGADGIVAEGCESGGHIGELTTMALVPQVCDAVDVPVIAAGGIASGRQMAAAFVGKGRGRTARCARDLQRLHSHLQSGGNALLHQQGFD